MCSHLAAFGTLYELKLNFADYITAIPLGYHLTIGSGRMRKIMDENIESIEKFIAHQFPDFVASLVAPLILVIILLAVDWRYGVVSVSYTHLDVYKRQCDISEKDSLLAVSSLEFDLSVYDIFGILGTGGTIVLLDEASKTDAAQWLDLVTRYHITCRLYTARCV